MNRTLYKMGMTFGMSIMMATGMQAALLYQFGFNGDDDAARLTSTGQLKDTAQVKVIDGQKVEFVADAPVKVKFSCKFTGSPDAGRAAMLILPGSAGQLSCAKAGDKLTVALWVKWNGTAREASGLVSKSSSAQNSGWMFRITPKGELSLGSCGGYGSRKSVATIAKDQWTHVAVTWDVGNSGGVVMYINGINAGIDQGYVGEAGCKANAETIRIGTQTPDFYLPLNGAVYDVRLYDEVLSPEAIQQLAKDNAAVVTNENIPAADKEKK
ncbi:MAG: LamG domain-containing protein [Lentisphaerota bacterium]